MQRPLVSGFGEQLTRNKRMAFDGCGEAICQQALAGRPVCYLNLPGDAFGDFHMLKGLGGLTSALERAYDDT